MDDFLPFFAACSRYSKLRDSIHYSSFENYISEQETDTFGKVENCIIIVCDNMKISKTGERVLNHTDFFQNVGEADYELYCERLDPVLKLYPNCEHMLTKNDDGRRSQINEARIYLVKL